MGVHPREPHMGLKETVAWVRGEFELIAMGFHTMGWMYGQPSKWMASGDPYGPCMRPLGTSWRGSELSGQCDMVGLLRCGDQFLWRLYHV